MRRRRRVAQGEIASFGFDEYLATVGGDPDRTPTNVGLRVPALVPLDPSTGLAIGYLFLGARADLDEGDAIIGYRTLASVGVAVGTNLDDSTAAPFVPFERAIESPGWRFVDGMIDAHLTSEPMAPARAQLGPVDQESFVYRDANSPALVYETATFPAIPTAPGYLGLSSYTPPPMRGKTEELTLRDMRTRWQRYSPLRIDVERPTSFRFYVRVVQSSPVNVEEGAPARAAIALTPSVFTIEGLTREDNFVQANPLAIYWRVGVALLVERRRPKRPKIEASVGPTPAPPP